MTAVLPNRIVWIALLAILVPAPAAFAASSPGFAPATPTGDLPYVIVTTKELAAAFQPLADWKTRTGLPAQVVTVEAIEGDPAFAGADRAEKIRSFLREAHLNWRTRWVCLGGHVSEVPSRGTHVVRGEYRTSGNISDLYFADVLPRDADPDGAVEIYNWNGDGDARFGEAQDGMDLASELYVARLPFTTGSQVEDYLKKYFAYAQGKDGDFLGRALVVGAEEFRASQEKLVKQLEGLGGEKGYVVETLIEVPVPDIVKAMNKGHGIVDIFGHGCPNHMWLGEKRSHFGVNQIRTLVNATKCGLVYSNGCSSNDYRQWESMGVSFLLNPKGGAIAYTGYTAAAFQAPVNYAFYDLVFTGAEPRLSRALALSKEKQLQDVWMNEYLATLGEPETWVWTEKPKTLSVEAKIQAGRPARLRLVSAAGDPIPGARVCLTQRNAFLAGATDEEGWVSLSALESSGKAKVFALAQNHVPYEGSINVARTEGAPLGAPKWIVDDDTEGESSGNGKGDLSPGETVELRLAWPAPLTMGTLTLEIEDRGVEVLRGALEAGKEAEGFLLKVKPSVRPGRQIWATARIEATGVEGSWSWTRPLPVQGPALRCVRVRVEDRKGNGDGRVGFEDAGGEISLFVTVFNAGNQAAPECTLKLTSEDGAVQVTAQEVRAGTVKAQDSLETRAPLTFSLAKDHDGHALSFLLEMRDREGGLWKATLRLEVPPAPPILLTHTAATRFIALAWRPGGSEGVTGYHVYRADRAGGTAKRLTEKPIQGMTLYRDLAVGPNDDYYYTVTAVTAAGLESAPSMEHHARTLTPLWGRRK